MPRPNPHRPFTPDPAQMACAPPISGNTVNGLGERRFRRPDVVYWAPDPGAIPHGRMQRWFYTVEPNEPSIIAERAARRKVLDAPLPPVAAVQTERSPEAWTAALQGFVADGHCEQVGVTPLDSDWLFEGQETALANVLVMGVQHAYAEIATAPKTTAGAEVMRQYRRAAAVAKAVAGWLRQSGWDAEPVTGPMAGKITLIPPALACGFGELGKHGSLITPEMGASFRLSAVLTDAPFAPTPPRDHGIDAFCASCRVCEDACPPEAIFPDKQTVRGQEKWYVDFDKCLPFFNETNGCAICIAVCPWSRPGVGPNLAAKLARRAERLADEGQNGETTQSASS